MNEAVCSKRSQERTEARGIGLCSPSTEAMQPLAYHLELYSMPALLTAMTTIARLGGRLTHVFASDLQATIGLLVPAHVAHRVQVCLSQNIGVGAVTETSLPIQDGEELSTSASMDPPPSSES